ncbi:MAG: hydrogenase, partial [Acidobacteria bacterium]|nr:hydrogenase [Acidobacteriota bacterium]
MHTVAEIDPVVGRPALIAGEPDFHSITESVAAPMEWKPPVGWYAALGVSLLMLSLFGISIGWLFWEGVGIWGNNQPVAWG